MALLDSTPQKVDDHTERTYTFDGNMSPIGYHDDQVRVYEWACDDTGGETTHEATYGVGGFELVWYGRRLAYGKAAGVWREVYRKWGTYTPIT